MNLDELRAAVERAVTMNSINAGRSTLRGKSNAVSESFRNDAAILRTLGKMLDGAQEMHLWRGELYSSRSSIPAHGESRRVLILPMIEEGEK